MYRFIWSIEIFSRLVNSLLLLFGFLYFIKNLSHNKYHPKIWANIIIPSLLIVFGMLMNIIISAFSDINILSSLGSLLPWVVLLMIPDLYRQKKINIKKLWKYSYYFMVVAVSLGLIDYVFIFVFNGSASVLDTSYGVFLGGKFSILHMIQDGTAHYRFYSCFAEPGSLAMLLLPFIAYAIYNKKYIGLIILMIGFYLAFSLGANISGVLMLMIMFYFKSRKHSIVLFFVLIFSALFLYSPMERYLSSQFEKKGDSSEIRNTNFTNGILKIPYLVFNKPFGIKLYNSTEDSKKNKNYVGSNFLPINYLQTGGLFAFLGYFIIIYASIRAALRIFRRYNYMTVESKVAALSLIVFLPFLAQRTTIWETAWFAFLYAPIIIDNLKKSILKT